MHSQPSRSGSVKADAGPQPVSRRPPGAWVGAAIIGSGTGVWEWRPGSDRLVWCGRCAELFGLRPVSLIAFDHAPLDRVAGCLPPRDMDRARGLVRSLERRRIDARRFCLDRPILDGEGKRRTIRLRGEVRTGSGGRPTVVSGTLHDVTRKATDLDRLRAATGELELLLREVNHRVRNSLQLVGNLLAMQALSCPDPGARTVLEDAYGRIVTVSGIHDRLHRMPPGGPVDVAEHLGALVADLRDSLLGPEHPVRLEFEGEGGFHLSAAGALPLALALNELVTNSLKHAFPAGGPGRVCVRLRRGIGAWELEVADNGKGLTAGADPVGRSGLGLRLVRSLAEQIGARLEYEGRNGLRVRLTVPA